jgi:hypothetical protein
MNHWKKTKTFYLTITSIISFACFVIVYFSLFFKQACFQEIEVNFNPSGSPLINIEIDGDSFPVVLDSGSKFQLSLHKSVLEKIHKIKLGTAQWHDFKGNFYESPSYLIPKIKIGNLTLTDVVVAEESEEFIENATLWKQESKEQILREVGSLGRPILEKFNLLLDLAHSKIVFCNNSKKLKNLGYSLGNMVQLPLKNGRGIILSAIIDIGEKQFNLDTGSTLNLMRTSLLQNQPMTKEWYGLNSYTSSHFILGKKDFGKIALQLYDITPELHEIDGVLGISFLEKHIVYIDYRNKVAYIGDSL